MKNSIQKTAIIIIAITLSILVTGNVLMAEDQELGDLISAGDIAFIKAAPTGIATGVVTDRQAQSAGLIPPADYAFVVREYTAASGLLQAQATPETAGLITAADYKFLTAGQVADFFSVYSDLDDSLVGRLAK